MVGPYLTAVDLSKICPFTYLQQNKYNTFNITNKKLKDKHSFINDITKQTSSIRGRLQIMLKQTSNAEQIRLISLKLGLSEKKHLFACTLFSSVLRRETTLRPFFTVYTRQVRIRYWYTVVNFTTK